MDNNKEIEIKKEELENWYKKEQEKNDCKVLAIKQAKHTIINQLETTFHSASIFIKGEVSDNGEYQKILQNQYWKTTQMVADEYDYHDRKIQLRIQLLKEEYTSRSRQLGGEDGRN